MNARLVLIGGMFLMLAIAWLAAFVLWRAAELGAEVAPLEPRTFESLTLVAAGTGAERENPARKGPLMAVAWDTNVVLVDAGRAAAESLRGAGLPVTQPSHLLLTNLLPENTVGLDDLLATGWQQDRATPLTVIGPRGTSALVESLLAAHRGGLDALGAALPLPDEGRIVHVSEVDGGYEQELAGVTIRAAEIPGGPLPALAWRFDRGERAIVISGTGWAGDALVEFARGADLLVHEAVYVPPDESIEDVGVAVSPERLAAERALHTALEDVGPLAARAEVDGVVLVRLRPPPFFDAQLRSIVSQDFPGAVYVPEDGEEIVP